MILVILSPAFSMLFVPGRFLKSCHDFRESFRQGLFTTTALLKILLEVVVNKKNPASLKRRRVLFFSNEELNVKIPHQKPFPVSLDQLKGSPCSCNRYFEPGRCQQPHHVEKKYNIHPPDCQGLILPQGIPAKRNISFVMPFILSYTFNRQGASLNNCPTLR